MSLKKRAIDIAKRRKYFQRHYPGKTKYGYGDEENVRRYFNGEMSSEESSEYEDSTINPMVQLSKDVSKKIEDEVKNQKVKFYLGDWDNFKRRSNLINVIATSLAVISLVIAIYSLFS